MLELKEISQKRILKYQLKNLNCWLGLVMLYYLYKHNIQLFNSAKLNLCYFYSNDIIYLHVFFNHDTSQVDVTYSINIIATPLKCLYTPTNYDIFRIAHYYISLKCYFTSSVFSVCHFAPSPRIILKT